MAGRRSRPGTQKTSETNQCHDITVFPEVGLAAGACSGNGILLDISDPVKPTRLDHVLDKNFAYWHSATFNNDGTKVIFTDEWGGGTRPRCRATDPPTWGANAIFDVVDRKLRFASYYKLPAPQTELENCVAHNGSIIPVPGRDIMVQGWYQGGITVFDFTDSAKPVEIAFFDRGPVDEARLITAGHWSAYWYNGAIYGAEIARGIDVLRLKAGEQMSKNEVDAANAVRLPEFNAQQQPRVTWPATAAVAGAYLDQLTRSNGIERRAPRGQSRGRERRRWRDIDHSRESSRRRAEAPGADAARLRALAATLKALRLKQCDAVRRSAVRRPTPDSRTRIPHYGLHANPLHPRHLARQRRGASGRSCHPRRPRSCPVSPWPGRRTRSRRFARGWCCRTARIVFRLIRTVNRRRCRQV